MKSRLAQTARRKLIGSKPNDWQTYHEHVAGVLRPGMRVLDIGCGAGEINPFPWNEYPEVELIGLDPNSEAALNRNLDHFVLMTDAKFWAIADASIDLVVCRYVLEHVEQPDVFFANLHRVLRPGGRFIALTPNRFHPTVMVSAILPLNVKQRILKWTADIDDHDVFPTWYRLNTVNKVHRSAKQFGLNVRHASAREYVPNDYLNFNIVGFLLSYAYYQAVRWLYLERWFGMSIIAVLEKPELPDSSRIA